MSDVVSAILSSGDSAVTGESKYDAQHDHLYVGDGSLLVAGFTIHWKGSACMGPGR